MNIKWQIKNWFRVGRNISWKLNFETIMTILYFNKPFQNDFVYKFVNRKHEYVLNYIKSNCPDVIEKYRSIQNSAALTDLPEKRKIWVMWWQGESAAPAIVKKCIESIRNNSNGADVVVISEDNYQQYIKLPAHIMEKFTKGYISLAQLSDIMRVYLISEYGGLWLDATIYCSQKIPEEIFRMPFFTYHTHTKKTPFVQNNMIHCFIMAGTPGSKLLTYVKEMLTTYWQRNDVIVDYYLLDYTIMLAYWTYDDIRKMIDDLPYSSESLYELVESLDQPYNQEALDRILNSSLFSKLRWDKSFKTKANGKRTNYDVLFN